MKKSEPKKLKARNASTAGMGVGQMEEKDDSDQRNLRRVFDSDPGVRSTLDVDGRFQSIGDVVNCRPRHGWSTASSPDINRREDGRATRVVGTRSYVIRLECLGCPHELR